LDDPPHTQTTAVLQVPGGAGVVSYLSLSSTDVPVVARFDNFLAGHVGEGRAGLGCESARAIASFPALRC
jgi:hypothetical protein